MGIITFPFGALTAIQITLRQAANIRRTVVTPKKDEKKEK